MCACLLGHSEQTYNKSGSWSSSTWEPEGIMVSSRDLLWRNGKIKRIAPNLVFSLIRSPLLCAPQITFNPLLLQQKSSLLIFLPLVSWLCRFFQYHPGHLSYVLSTHLHPYFTKGSSPFCSACLRNLLFFESPLFIFSTHPLKPVSSRAPYITLG